MFPKVRLWSWTLSASFPWNPAQTKIMFWYLAKNIHTILHINESTAAPLYILNKIDIKQRTIDTFFMRTFDFYLLWNLSNELVQTTKKYSIWTISLVQHYVFFWIGSLDIMWKYEAEEMFLTHPLFLTVNVTFD